MKHGLSRNSTFLDLGPERVFVLSFQGSPAEPPTRDPDVPNLALLWISGRGSKPRISG